MKVKIIIKIALSKPKVIPLFFLPQPWTPLNTTLESTAMQLQVNIYHPQGRAKLPAQEILTFSQSIPLTLLTAYQSAWSPPQDSQESLPSLPQLSNDNSFNPILAVHTNSSQGEEY